MKRTLSYLILLNSLTGAYAQDAVPSVQVTPSDQVIYPDASQIINKTDPKKAAPLPPAPLGSSKPVVAATPVPARTTTAKTAAQPTVPGAHGWFLRWAVTGDEAGVRAWAAQLSPGAQVLSMGTDAWEVLSGPLAPEELGKAFALPGAQLVKR